MRWCVALNTGLIAVIAPALIWGSALQAVAAVREATVGQELDTPSAQLFRWEQETEQPPVEQVGEGTSGDTETLDRGAPPAQTPPAQEQPPGDVEPLDQGSPPPAQTGDVEPLDQGAPTQAAPAAAAPAAAPVPETTAAPVATTTAEPAGPVVPPGFGTGPVFAVAGMSSVPPGLESCHVGAVTGRAFVGIDCGDGGSVVGHAASFQDFPFVPETSFPFDDQIPLDVELPIDTNETDTATDSNGVDAALPSVSAPSDDVEVVAAAQSHAPGFFAHDASSAPVVNTTGSSSVELAQEAHAKKPHVHTSHADAKQTTESSNQSQAPQRTAKKSDKSSSDRSAKGRDKSQKHHGGGGNGAKKHKSAAKHQNHDKDHGKKQGNKKQHSHGHRH